MNSNSNIGIGSGEITLEVLGLDDATIANVVSAAICITTPDLVRSSPIAAVFDAAQKTVTCPYETILSGQYKAGAILTFTNGRSMTSFEPFCFMAGDGL